MLNNIVTFKSGLEVTLSH